MSKTNSMNGLGSVGIKLEYKALADSSSSYLEIEGLQSIPDMGGSSESIEVTTLGDASRKYIKGIKSYGDSLDFVFLYKTSVFESLTMSEAQGGELSFRVSLPDGATCTFTGEHSVKLNSTGVNAAITYTLSVKPTSEMTWA